MTSTRLSTAEIVLRAAQVVERKIADRGRVVDLTPRQIDVLLALADAPGLSQHEMQDHCSMDRSTLSALVRRLIARGFIKRRASDDARSPQNFLTPEGDVAVKVARRIRKQVDREVDGVIPDGVRHALLTLLTTERMAA